ncbi:MAG: PilZ domain-containing protein [Pseudolabrys sp.]
MERRRAQREAIREDASIIYGMVNSVDCVVQDLSLHGACLEVAPPASSVSIPKEFVLFRPATRSVRNCRVIWRSFQRIGVEFK